MMSWILVGSKLVAASSSIEEMIIECYCLLKSMHARRIRAAVEYGSLYFKVGASCHELLQPTSRACFAYNVGRGYLNFIFIVPIRSNVLNVLNLVSAACRWY